jgi:dTDP-4-amino-4,6-dideoxygalactose transaminase
MININKVIIPNKHKLLEKFSSILDSGKLTNNGKHVKDFEIKLSKKLNTVKPLAVCNGTIALHLAIKSLPTKGEIITTPFSCIASTSSIIWEGFTPVFCDIDEHTFCIDSKLIEAKITDKTVAILGVHVYGNTCNVDAIDKIAKKYNLKVIYDGAHAFGTSYNKQSVFNFGDITTLSLHAYKIVSSIEGGAIFCTNKENYEALYKMRYFGKNRENIEEILGTNAKMNEFNAAYGILSLKRSKQELKARKKIAQFYIDSLSNNTDLKFQKIEKKATPNFSYFPVVFPSSAISEKILAKGLNKEIILRKYFYPSINSIKYIGADAKRTPISESLSKRILCLPIHSNLSESDLNKIVDLIKQNL